MCLGPELAAVLAIAGTAASVAGQQQQAKFAREAQERNDSFLLGEMQRQGQYADEANRRVMEAAPELGAEGFDQRLDAARQQREEALVPIAQDAAAGGYKASPGTPQTVADVGAARVAGAQRDAAKSASNLAGLGAYGLADIYGNVSLSNLVGNLGRINTLSRGSAGATRTQQQIAMNQYNSEQPFVGEGWATAGDLLGGGSDIAAIYGATNQRKKTSDPWEISRGQPKTIYDPGAGYYP